MPVRAAMPPVVARMLLFLTPTIRSLATRTPQKAGQGIDKPAKSEITDTRTCPVFPVLQYLKVHGWPAAFENMGPHWTPQWDPVREGFLVGASTIGLVPLTSDTFGGSLFLSFAPRRLRNDYTSAN